MGEIKIQFSFNRETGRTDLTVDYSSDRSAMPHEHEERHEEIVERLIEGGVIRRQDLGNVEVKRIPHEKTRGKEAAPEEPGENEPQAGSAGT